MGTRIEQLLTLLADSGFECVVIGGTAAIAHGAVTPTDDVDVAAPMTEENLGRLLDALRPYHPKHATRPDLGVIRHTPAQLTSFRLLLIDTDLGRLDVLARVEPLGGYESLESVPLELVQGKIFRVLALDQLIAVKEHLRRPKDKIVEVELKAIRDRLRGVRRP